jgi:hypothetical protein
MAMSNLLQDVEQLGLSRRKFLHNFYLCAGSVATAKLLTACSSGRNLIGDLVDPNFESGFATMGALLAANADGIQLPAEFTSKEVAVFNENPLTGANAPNGFNWHADPDGGGTFKTADGGWIYVSNAEIRDPLLTGGAPRETFGVQLLGGVSALQFAANGDLIDAYTCQSNSTTNCSGGATPWGTWINGEEIVDGFMFECSPVRDGGDAVRLDRFGRKGHEMVSVDPDGKAIYHTEDAGGSDRFYRTVFNDAAWPDGGRPDMSQGVLQVLSLTGFGDDSNYDSTSALAAARIGPTPITWLNAVDDGSPQEDVRLPQSTEFVGNEGVWYLDGFIFFSTKSDNNIWAIDRDGNTVESIFDGDGQEIQGSFADPSEPEMFGVDNIAMTLDGEMLIVEDGGDMRCMVRLPDGRTIPLLRLPGNASLTEVTGVAISPAGDKIYVSGQRSLRNGVAPGTPATAGITYEITMPFTVRVDRPLAQAMPVS